MSRTPPSSSTDCQSKLAMSARPLNMKPGIEQVQALADISRSALCCHSNETRALSENPRNSAELKGILYHSPKLHPGLCSSVDMRQGTDRPTHTHRRP